MVGYRKKRRSNTSNLGIYAQKKDRIVSPSETERQASLIDVARRRPLAWELRMLHIESTDDEEQSDREVTVDANLCDGNRITSCKISEGWT